MTEAAIVFDDVSVTLGGTSVLREIDLFVERGELLGVIGPNGAGKSTLLMLINGLRRPSSGSIEVLGLDPHTISSSALAQLRHRIGFVPQLPAHDTCVPVSVRQVVEIARTGLAGLFRPLGKHDTEVVDTWLERLGIMHLADRSFPNLSGGEQRKVHLARALAQEPEILLLDEPASALDIHWQEELISLIDQLWKETHLTVLMVTHEVHQLPTSCCRIALMSNGLLKSIGSPDTVLRPDVLRDVFGSEVEVVARAGRHYLLPGR